MQHPPRGLCWGKSSNGGQAKRSLRTAVPFEGMDFVALTGDCAGAARAREQRRKFCYNWAREKSFTERGTVVVWTRLSAFQATQQSSCVTLFGCRVVMPHTKHHEGVWGSLTAQEERRWLLVFAVTLLFGRRSLSLQRRRRHDEEWRDRCLPGLLW